MSMHEIEGLVEDSVHLVAKSSMAPSLKRDFLFNLYRFQAMFDTGYTHFRVIDTLLDLKFTYRIPLEKHPDYAEHKAYFDGLNVAREPWINASIAAKGGWVFSKKEEDGIFLYTDAGSEFWQRLLNGNNLPISEHQPPEKHRTSYLIWKLLEEALRQRNTTLLRDWYACLVNMIGIDLGPEDGFPKGFLDFIATKEALAIRNLGKATMPFNKSYQGDDWGFLARPVLKEIEEEVNDIDRLYCLKWLLDFKSGEAKIKADYLIEITPDPLRDEKIQLVPKAMAHHLGTEKWKLVYHTDYKYGHKWMYYQRYRGDEGKPKDSDIHLYLLFDADSEDLRMVYPKIGVQNGLLLRWQGRGERHLPEAVHFFEPLNAVVPGKELEGNKSIAQMGGWKYNLKVSPKTIQKHLDNLFENYVKYADLLIGEFQKPLFGNFEMSLKQALAYREKMQNTHRFFLNQIEVYLVYAIHHFEKGEKEKAFALANEAKSMAAAAKHPIAKEWILAAESIVDAKPQLNELLSFVKSYSLNSGQ